MCMLGPDASGRHAEQEELYVILITKALRNHQHPSLLLELSSKLSHFALVGEMRKVNFIGYHEIAPAILQEENPSQREVICLV